MKKEIPHILTKSLISRNSRIAFGRYVIRGTGIAVTVLKERNAAGDSATHLAEDYGITYEQVQAALNFRKKKQDGL